MRRVGVGRPSWSSSGRRRRGRRVRVERRRRRRRSARWSWSCRGRRVVVVVVGSRRASSRPSWSARRIGGRRRGRSSVGGDRCRRRRRSSSSTVVTWSSCVGDAARRGAGGGREARRCRAWSSATCSRRGRPGSAAADAQATIGTSEGGDDRDDRASRRRPRRRAGRSIDAASMPVATGVSAERPQRRGWRSSRRARSSGRDPGDVHVDARTGRRRPAVTRREVGRRARGLRRHRRAEHADRVVEDAASCVLHAGSVADDDAERRRRVAGRHVVAERLAGEQQVVGAAVLGVGDEVERLAEDGLGRRAPSNPPTGTSTAAVGGDDEPVVPRDRRAARSGPAARASCAATSARRVELVGGDDRPRRVRQERARPARTRCRRPCRRPARWRGRSR